MPKKLRNSHNPACKCAPNLYLAANFLEPDDKYTAFLAVRSAMDSVDGLANGNQRAGKLTRRVKNQILSKLDRFARMFRNRSFDNSLPYTQDLKLAIARFNIPDWPFAKMAEAMKFNLENDRFESFERLAAFLQDTAAPPASIFFHLAGCSFDERGQLNLPSFDIEAAARPMASFCSLTHILIDCKADFLSDPKPIIYLDLDTTESFHITENHLAEAVHTGKPSLKLTKMIMRYYNQLTEFQTEAEKALCDLIDQLPEDGQFAISFIFEIYSQLTTKISNSRYNLFKDNFDLTPDEIEAAALAAAGRSCISPEQIADRLGALISPKKAALLP